MKNKLENLNDYNLQNTYKYRFNFFSLIFLIRSLKKRRLKKLQRKTLFFSSKKKINGKLIWFHGASVGEFQSIVPLLEKLDKDKSITNINYIKHIKFFKNN